MQLALFDAAPALPRGFAYQPDFLTPEHETEILDAISRLDFRNFRWHEYVGKRRTVTFGWGYSFDTGELQPAEPLPLFLLPVRASAAAWAGLPEKALEQALITEYSPGAAIGWHRDAPPFGIILGVSLLSDCRFRLRLEEPKTLREMTVERRSIYKLSGEARRPWQHSIPPAKQTRYSITFRTMR